MSVQPTQKRGTAELRRKMSVKEFDDGYFYAAELKRFAREVGISVGNRRKFEVEDLIRSFLETGVVPASQPTLPRNKGEERDRLALDEQVRNYVDDKETKEFLLDAVRSSSPGIKKKSGQWYWLNDWRRKQQERQAVFTYQDVVDHLSKLMHQKGRLPQVPSARMNNFITDLRADPVNSEMTRDEVQQEWRWLKKQPGPKTYAEYKRLRGTAENSNG